VTAGEPAGPAGPAGSAGHAPALDTGLARYLGEQWDAEVTVELRGESSAGARRQQVLFDATLETKGAERETRPLVATVIQQPELLIVSVAGEAESILLAEKAGVPVPHIWGYTQDESYIGSPFFVGSRVEGESVPRRVLRAIPSAEAGEDLARQCGAALAHLHQVPVEQIHTDMLRPLDDNPAETAVSLLDEHVTNELLQPMPVYHLARRWLLAHLPATPHPHRIVHGDFRNGNMIVDGGRLAAVLDWEICHNGDPFQDVAWFCIRAWRFGNDDRPAGGFGSLEAYREGYEVAGGVWDEDRFGWWYVFGNLSWAVGLARQAAGHVRGEVRNIVMCASGRRVPELEYDLLEALRPHLA
jgi:aminoglycoside phosphotransferase (APT) family kinase protein